MQVTIFTLNICRDTIIKREWSIKKVICLRIEVHLRSAYGRPSLEGHLQYSICGKMVGVNENLGSWEAPEGVNPPPPTNTV